MNVPHIDIIGLIRFSHPSPIGYKVDAGSERAQEAFLYDTDRLERRFKLFEHITLPSLAQQTTQNFKIIFMIGENFPNWARARLDELIKDIPAVIITQPYLFSGRAANRCFKEVFDKNADGFMSFALDDDDAISKTWTECLNEFGHDALTLSEKFGPIGYYPSQGYFIQNVDMSLDPITLINREKPYWLGSAILTKHFPEQTIYQIAHQQLPDHMQVFADGSAPNFLRLVHGDSDTAKNIGRQMDKLLIAPDQPIDVIEDIEKRFGVKPRSIEALFEEL